eukprot:9597662-Ditylum_brightwellii.AAC.1
MASIDEVDFPEGSDITVHLGLSDMLAATKEDTSLADGKVHATPTVITAKEGKVSKLMNMQEHIEEDSIAEQIRVEGTKAAPTAAKEGMEH